MTSGWEKESPQDKDSSESYDAELCAWYFQSMPVVEFRLSSSPTANTTSVFPQLALASLYFLQEFRKRFMQQVTKTLPESKEDSSNMMNEMMASPTSDGAGNVSFTSPPSPSQLASIAPLTHVVYPLVPAYLPFSFSPLLPLLSSHSYDIDLGSYCVPQADHELLTDDGFRSFAQVQAALRHEGGRVRVACPVRVAEGRYRLEYHAITLRELTDTKSGADGLVMLRSGCGDVDLLVTGNHRMLVRLGSVDELDERMWEERTAKDVAAVSEECVQLLCHAAEGVEDPTPELPLPFAAPLGLTGADEEDAFIQLYGYWVCAGHLDCRDCTVRFPAYRRSVIQRIDALLARLRVPLIGEDSEGPGYSKQSLGSRDGPCEDDGELEPSLFLIHHPLYWAYLAQHCVDGLSSSHDDRQPSLLCDTPSPLALRAPLSVSPTSITALLSEEEEGSPSSPEPPSPSAQSEDTALSPKAHPLRSWVFDRLDARRARLLLSAMRESHGNHLDELTALAMLPAKQGSTAVSDLPLSPAWLNTPSASRRDQILHLALRAGFSARFERVPGGWRVHYAHALTAGASQAQPALRIRPAAEGNPRQVMLCSDDEPIPVWCVSIPTSEHLIVVRRVTRDVCGVVVSGSRPCVVGNSYSSTSRGTSFFHKLNSAYKALASSAQQQQQLKAHNITQTSIIANMLSTSLLYLNRFAADETVVSSSLELLEALSLGYASSQLLSSSEPMKQILSSHRFDAFPFLTRAGAQKAKLHCAFYLIIGRVLFKSGNVDNFETFMAPFEQSFAALQAMTNLRSEQSALATIALTRKLQGLLEACVSYTTYMLMFDWLYPAYLPLILRLCETFADNVVVASSILHLFCEFAFNRSQRIRFDANSANGIILFRETSNLLNLYAHRLLNAKPESGGELYKQKIKGVSLSLTLLARALSGGYANFGIMALYDDHALTSTFKLMLQLIISLQLSDLLSYPMLAEPYFAFLEIAYKQHTQLMVDLEGKSQPACTPHRQHTTTLLPSSAPASRAFLPISPSLTLTFTSLSGLVCSSLVRCAVFWALVSSLHEGLQSFSVACSTHCAAAIDYLFSFVVQEQRRKRHAPNYPRLLKHLQAAGSVVYELFSTLLSMYLFDSVPNTYSLSRPIFTLLVYEQSVWAQYSERLMALQGGAEAAQRVREVMADCMQGIALTLDHESKDKFFSHLTSMKNEFSTFAVRMT